MVIFFFQKLLWDFKFVTCPLPCCVEVRMKTMVCHFHELELFCVEFMLYSGARSGKNHAILETSIKLCWVLMDRNCLQNVFYPIKQSLWPTDGSQFTVKRRWEDKPTTIMHVQCLSKIHFTDVYIPVPCVS